MDIIFDNDGTRLTGLTHFSLEQCLSSGQTFRWQPKGAGFSGVALGRSVYAEQRGSTLWLLGVDEAAAGTFVRYFDLQRDYGAIQQSYVNDPFLSEGISYAGGLRVLRQPLFETLISFIISANNNVPRISRIIETMCGEYGAPIPGGHDFPTPDKLAALAPEDLRRCGAGYRAESIIGAARMVCDGFSLEAVAAMSYDRAREALMTLPGVGPKVADCVALYGMGFLEAFPADVWIRRVICGVYGYNGKNDRDLRRFVDTTFGTYAGIAQQYLFHYARHHKEAVCVR